MNELLPMTARLIERLERGSDLLASEIPPKVLIVDDNPYDVQLLARQLKDLGCEVHSVSEGETGLDYIMRNRPPKMIFIDLGLPGLAGAGVMRVLQSLLPGLPFCIYSGLSTVDVEATASKYGCPILRKPATEAEIRKVMEIK